MEIVEGHLVVDHKQDQGRACHAYGEAGQVQRGEGLAAPEIAESGEHIVFNHKEVLRLRRCQSCGVLIFSELCRCGDGWVHGFGTVGVRVEVPKWYLKFGRGGVDGNH